MDIKMKDVWKEIDFTYGEYLEVTTSFGEKFESGNGGLFGLVFSNEEPAKAMMIAISNHDRLTEENARLRELLSKSNSLLITAMVISEDDKYTASGKIKRINFHKKVHVNPHVIMVDELLNKETK